jgi:hypothetical protein
MSRPDQRWDTTGTRFREIRNPLIFGVLTFGYYLPLIADAPGFNWHATSRPSHCMSYLRVAMSTVELSDGVVVIDFLAGKIVRAMSQLILHAQLRCTRAPSPFYARDMALRLLRLAT